MKWLVAFAIYFTHYPGWSMSLTDARQCIHPRSNEIVPLWMNYILTIADGQSIVVAAAHKGMRPTLGRLVRSFLWILGRGIIMIAEGGVQAVVRYRPKSCVSCVYQPFIDLLSCTTAGQVYEKDQNYSPRTHASTWGAFLEMRSQSSSLQLSSFCNLLLFLFYYYVFIIYTSPLPWNIRHCNPAHQSKPASSETRCPCFPPQVNKISEENHLVAPVITKRARWPWRLPAQTPCQTLNPPWPTPHIPLTTKGVKKWSNYTAIWKSLGKSSRKWDIQY